MGAQVDVRSSPSPSTSEAGHRLPVDPPHLELEQIKPLDAAEIDPVAVLGVLAVGDIREDATALAEVVLQHPLVPPVEPEVGFVSMRREILARNIARGQ